MSSDLIKALQRAKTAIERANKTRTTLYDMLSVEIYRLEREENLPYDWRDEMPEYR